MTHLPDFPSPLIPLTTEAITPENACCVIYQYTADSNSRVERRQQHLIGRHAARTAWCHQAAQIKPGTRSLETRHQSQDQELPIPTGAYGEPVFPPGMCGSISHTVGWGGAIVAPVTAYQSVGIDFELANRLVTPGVKQRIIQPSEVAWCQTNPPPGLSSYALALFTAKEAIVKTVSPILQRLVLLDEVRIDWSPQSHTGDSPLHLGCFTLDPTTALASYIGGCVVGTTTIIAPLVISIATIAAPPGQQSFPP